MEELTRVEERVMQALWQISQGFVKDIIAALDENPKPPYTTISSVVRILETKGFVTHKPYGNTHEYFPAISLEQYRRGSVQKIIRHYFNNKRSNLLAYLMEEKKLTAAEIKQLKSFMDAKSKKR